MKNLIGSRLLIGPLKPGQIVTYGRDTGFVEFALVERHLRGEVYLIYVVDGDGSLKKKRVHRKWLFGPPPYMKAAASKFYRLMDEVFKAEANLSNSRDGLLEFALKLSTFDAKAEGKW